LRSSQREALGTKKIFLDYLLLLLVVFTLIDICLLISDKMEKNTKR